ncbi:metallophosphoesterase family protein [Caulobacter sp. KR2-114]|uniref:metallophosphoesterase family protein n=1 Tax=Caulobacter sp. KR2-114 TaxID=3400912 RepID=UPI003BFD72B6
MRRLAGAILSLILGAVAGRAAQAAEAPTVWVEVTGRGTEVRAVTAEAACPAITVDGHRRRMTERAAPTDAFANRICVAALSRGVRTVRLAGQALPVPKARPRRLVILGDSGCRLKGPIVQDCNDPKSGWPFALVSALAAKQKPDLVVHVGDYYYRETPCPAGDARCAGSPFGDRWATWRAEVFAPAAPLLAAAPWVFARGNHEDCQRGGAGWFRLLDASQEVRACPAQSDTFAVELGGVRLLVLDSADPDDFTLKPDQEAAFVARMDAMDRLRRGEPAWLVTHRPFWVIERKGDALSDGLGNVNLRAAAKGRDLKGIDLVLVGHVHNFTSLDFGAARPPELIVGAGGDLQSPADLPAPAVGPVSIDGLQAQAFTMGRFGYFVFDRKGADWMGAFHDLTDAVIARCRLHAARLTCEQA